MSALPVNGRPCRGRTVAWSRTVLPGGKLRYQVFRRSIMGKVHQASFVADATWSRDTVAKHLVAARAQARWAADRVSLEELGLVDPTPAPPPAGLEWAR